MCIYRYLQNTANYLDHMYNYVYAIEQNNAKINDRTKSMYLQHIMIL